jgi:hypothetical protein
VNGNMPAPTFPSAAQTPAVNTTSTGRESN